MNTQHTAACDDRPDEGDSGASGRAKTRLGTSLRPGRTEVLAAVTRAMAESGRRWAWLGPYGARAKWVGQQGPKDLDLWCDGDGDPSTDPVAAFAAMITCARVAEAHHPGRLRHVILAVETADGPAVVDIDHGDLRVGPVLLVPAAEVTIDRDRQCFTAAAAVADLLIRPVLRGRLPEPARMAEARAAWVATAAQARQRLIDLLAAQLGISVTRSLITALRSADTVIDPTLPRRARTQLALESLTWTNLASTWAQRRTVLPAGGAAGPLGLRVRGVVVALIGTDGSGKTTVAEGLDLRLRQFGMRTGAAYFGMARGNLPGVRSARRLLGAGRARAQRQAAGGGAPAPDPTAPVARAVDYPRLRQAAAWFYAGEYVLRYLWEVVPHRCGRRVVVVDRWVYDLRESPWPGSRAAQVVRYLLPEPDVLILPDAPVDLIHRRKPERPSAEQAAEQENYRALVAQRPARYAEVVVDTSGGAADSLAEAVAVVIEAAHRPRREPRRDRRSG